MIDEPMQCMIQESEAVTSPFAATAS